MKSAAPRSDLFLKTVLCRARQDSILTPSCLADRRIVTLKKEEDETLQILLAEERSLWYLLKDCGWSAAMVRKGRTQDERQYSRDFGLTDVLFHGKNV